MGCTSSSKRKSIPYTSDSDSIDLKMSGQNFLTAQFPAMNSQQRIGGDQSQGRKKVALKPGRSLMDWIRLGRSGEDLTGVGGKVQEVTQEELAKHNTEKDSWISLRGKVYNVSQYMEYHPGGIDELMRGSGIDATQLFDEVHKWVNFESMLEKCYVGKLKAVTPVHKRVSSLRGSISSQTSLLPPPGPPANGPSISVPQKPQDPPPPRFDWFQSNDLVTIVVYPKWKDMRHENVVIDYTDGHLLLTIYIQEYIYYLHIELEDMISDKFDIKVHKDTGKTEIFLKKMSPGVQWKCIGKYLDKHNKFIKITDQDIVYKRCTIESISEVTHDTKLLCLALPQGCRMCIPLGYHVHIKHKISGMEVVRSYTVALPSLDPEQQDSRVLEGRLFYLMIKIYKDGALTPWIDTLNTGDIVDISNYDGNFTETRFHKCKHLILFAAGTGFTPMIRLIYQCLIDSTSDRQCKLIFFNKKERDILWKDQLDSLSSQSERFSVHYILSEPDETWSGLKGRVNKEMMKMFLTKKVDTDSVDSSTSSSSGSDMLICACGPTPFTKSVQQYTEDLGYKDSFHAFLG